ncbi:NlpC/P60 family protein [Kitasatospora sp. NPDC096147]|uniref:C40 family peptidase n=1 Tax=Kitasatospora sp. NPDC096147 TaxID=3364093 RepID=UPI0038015D2E
MTAAAAAAVVLSSQTGAHADPQPSKDEVKTQIDNLNEQAEVTIEQFNANTEKQQALQTQVGHLQDEVARGQEQVNALQASLGEIAAEQYRTGGISPTVQLMLSSSPDAFLGQAGAINQVGVSQSDALKQLKGEQERLDQQKAETQAKLADLEKTSQQLKAQKDDVQDKLAKAQALFDSLDAAEKQKIREAEEKAAAEASAKAAAAAQAAAAAKPAQSAPQAPAAKAPAADDRASRSEERTDLSSSAPAGSYAAAVVAAAEAQIGKPYGWGATGPGAFDCSGLMVWAFNKAGISLPRTSQSQAGAGTNIGKNIADAKPGDLIIYYGDRHHVGLYVGGGQIVHAPRTGTLVRHESATVMPINAIVRV